MIARVEAVAERSGNDAARALGLFLAWGNVDETDDLRTVAAATERARSSRSGPPTATRS